MAVKEEYRLQTLMKIRERKKEEAEQALAVCLKALHAEQERLREMEAELQRMVAKRIAKTREYAEKTMRGEMNAQEAVTANVFIDRLKEMEDNQKSAIEGQKAVIAQKEEDVAAARSELVKATQDLKALEKHREKWLQEIKKAEEAKLEETMDEIAQTIFLKNDR